MVMSYKGLQVRNFERAESFQSNADMLAMFQDKACGNRLTWDADKTPATVSQYEVIDRVSGLRVGKPLTKQGARHKAEKLDLAYGAIRYKARRIIE